MKLMFDDVSRSRDKKDRVLLEAVTKQENPDKPRTIKLIGPAVICEMETINGRIFPLDVMVESVKNYDDVWVKSCRGYGELDHSDNAYIRPKEAADRIIRIWRDDKDEKIFMTESVVMATDQAHGIHGTPQGDVLAGLLSHGGKVGRSTRGIGDVGADKQVVPGYYLVCVDTVIDPSGGPGCFSEMITEGVLTTKEFMINEHGVIIEKAYDSLNKALATLPRHDKNAYVLEAVRKFLNSI
jgi:hypothetical protein